MSENVKQFKLAMVAYLSSKEVTTNDLRVYGRIAGVKCPTTKRNSVLIEEITGILAGEIEPVELSQRGAPVKNKVVNPEVLKKINQICEDYHIFDKYEKKQPKTDSILPSLFPKVQHSPTLVLEQSLNEEDIAYTGQLVYIKEVYYLFPLDCKKGGRILVSEQTVEEYGLREGDVVVCRAIRGERTLVATVVLSINGLVAKTFSRVNFDEEMPCYPEKPLQLDGVDKNTSLKYFDWVAPIKKGQRACIVAPPKTGKTQMLYDLAVATKNGDDKTITFVLLVDQSPESVGKFRRAFREDRLIYTTYEDDVDFQVFSADFLLKRAKRFVEQGFDVVLFIDSLSTLAKVYNDTDASMGGKTLAGGLESKTLQYIKRFFSSARQIEKGGSLTVVGTLSSDTGNPADELICSELGGISNYEIRLSQELATKRIYPAIEPLFKGEETVIGAQEQEICGNYLSKFSKENFIQSLSESKSKDLFYENMKKSFEL